MPSRRRSINWGVWQGTLARIHSIDTCGRSHLKPPQIQASVTEVLGLRGWAHATASIAQRLQENLCNGRVARRAPMTVGKEMNRVGGQRVVEIDAGVRKFAEDRGGQAELRSEEIATALMSQDHSHAARHFFAN